MNTLLILGSKPNPVLPPTTCYEAIACANASGRIAAHYDLPSPLYTVISAILTSGAASGHDSLRALAGLQTGTVYFLPRPPRGGSPWKRFVHGIRTWHMRPAALRSRLGAVSYRYDRFLDPGWRWYREVVHDLCDHDADVVAQFRRKHPSSGIIALAVGMALGDYRRYLLAGFSFQIVHGYGDNPEAAKRGTTASRHAQTDIAVIDYLTRRYNNVYTTEPVVHERAGVPLFIE